MKVAAIVEQRRQAEAEYRRTVLSDLAQADQKARSLQEELVKAEQKHHRQTLTTPNICCRRCSGTNRKR